MSPRSPTEIPYLAFTHHRIAAHDRLMPARKIANSEPLQSFLDLSRWSDVDRQRSLELAYLESANRSDDPMKVQCRRRRALLLLEDVRVRILQDAEMFAGLARLPFDLHLPDMGVQAERALQFDNLRGQNRGSTVPFEVLSCRWRSSDSGMARSLRTAMKVTGCS